LSGTLGFDVRKGGQVLALAGVLALEMAVASGALESGSEQTRAARAEVDRAGDARRKPPPVDAFVLAAELELLNPKLEQREPDCVQIVAGLQALGPQAIPVLCGMLCGEIACARRDAQGVEVPMHPLLALEHPRLLREALAAFDAGLVVQHLAERAGPGAPIDVRLTAAGLLAHSAHEQAFDALVGMVRAMEPLELESGSARAALEDALARQWARQPRSRARCESLAQDLDRDRLAVLARAAASAGTAEAAEFLLSLLGRDLFDHELDGVVLRELGRLGARGALELDPSHLGTLRGVLDSSEPELRRLASAALGALGDVEACAPLVELLESHDPLGREAARRGLRAICGVDLGTQASRWSDWLEAEQAWWNESAPAVIAALTRGQAAELLRALSELERHPLQRRSIAAELGPLAIHADPLVARAACRALARTASRGAVPWLLEALASADERTRQESAAALRELTGLDLPPEAVLWWVALDAASAD